MEIKEITFEEIFPVWSICLWPNRKSEIKPISSITFSNDIDMDIYDNTPTFFGIFYNNELVGVNSGFKTSETEYRSRGLYVNASFRRCGAAKRLLEATEEQAKKEHCSFLWSMPRESAIKIYESFGFKRTSDWFDEGVEFGPNCFVLKEI